jgi:hypothetical protein
MADEQPIHAYFITKRYSPGTECQFRTVMIKARGHGEVIVTPIIDGMICDLPLKSPPVPGHRRGEVMHFFFDDDTHAEELYAPRANNPFGYIGHDIQLKVECNGANEDITIYPPQIGYRPMKLKEGGKRSAKSSSAVSFAGLY